MSLSLSFGEETFMKISLLIKSGVVIYFVLLLSSPCSVFADSDFRFDDVSVEGNRRIDSEAIKLQLSKRSGQISEEEISQNVSSLYKTGFFDQVTANITLNPSGQRVLVFKVLEKPVIRKVFLDGNSELESNDLLDIFKLGANRFLDKTRLNSLIKNASALYQQKGFYDATMDYTIEPVSDGQVDVTFHVKEGNRYKIEKINFQGLETLDSDDLRDVMQTKRYKWWSSWLLGTGRLNMDMLENDRALIRQYFLDNGLVDATVSEPTVEKEEGKIKVSFNVKEGQKYSIGNISASGDLVEGSSSKTLEGIKIKSRDTFNASKLRDESFRISDKFSDVGYAFANVIPNTFIRKTDETVDIDFESKKGNLVTVDKISVRGNKKTYDNVIRRELKISEGDLYSSSRVRRSQELLQRLGYFEEVSIANEPSPEKDKTNLLVNVKEASTGQFSTGAGYSTSDGLLFNARLAENNIMGTGKRVELNVDIGTQRNNAALSYLDRRVADSYFSWGAEAFASDREFLDFDRVMTGAGTNIGYPLEEVFGEKFQDIRTGLEYQFANVDIRDVKDSAAQLVRDSEGSSTVSSVTPSLVRNTINNPLNPSKGALQSVSYEIAGLGGDEEFGVISGKVHWYYPFVESEYGDLVFSWRTRVDYGDSFNDEPFPLFKRFFPGGINSVRGYRNRSLGPVDENGNKYGGSKQIVNNAEIIFPIINSAGIRGVLFYDAGEAFDDDDSIDMGNLRRSWGFGLRWSSPLGPIRIEFGLPISRKEGEDRMNPMFSFGAPL